MKFRDESGGWRSRDFKKGDFFKVLSPEARADFESLASVDFYLPEQILFRENQISSRIHLLLEGQVKLCRDSSDGKRLILQIANPGQFLGLGAVLSGDSYQMTAEAHRTCSVGSMRYQDFQDLLLRYPAAYSSVVLALVREYSQICERLRMVTLEASAPVKLASLLLEWSAVDPQVDSGARFHIDLTHSEIGEFIGTSRETVTRTLSAFRHRNLVEFHGTSLSIPSRMALKSYRNPQ
jgi:CRP/FNR family transcriptional regulator